MKIARRSSIVVRNPVEIPLGNGHVLGHRAVVS